MLRFDGRAVRASYASFLRWTPTGKIVRVDRS
jgi:hypothetical protein